MSTEKILPLIFSVLGNLLAIRYLFNNGWTSPTVLFLLWAESITLGVVTLGKILFALPGYDPGPGRCVKYLCGEGNSTVSYTTELLPVRKLFVNFGFWYWGIVAISGCLGASALGESNWASLREQAGGIALVLLLDFGQQVMFAFLDFLHGPDWARHDPIFQFRGVWSRAACLYLLIFAVFFMGRWKGFLVFFIVVKTLIEIFIINISAKSSGEWRRSFPFEEGELDNSQPGGSSAEGSKSH
jgi:hypothetical protein